MNMQPKPSTITIVGVAPKDCCESLRRFLKENSITVHRFLYRRAKRNGLTCISFTYV